MPALHRCSSLLFLCALLPLLATADTPKPSGYLNKADIGYVVPPAPTPESAIQAADLQEVKAAQAKSEEWRREQAFEDAAAYYYDQLLPRFSQAAATPLSLNSRPILAHMLRLVLEDARAYARSAKGQNRRARPFVQDATITPCETDGIPLSEYRSYPSGHTTNAHAAALLLSRVMPERQAMLMARAQRYGDNRVVCGVHYPSDVAEGRKLAAAYFDKLEHNPSFQADLACAIEEHKNSIAVRKLAQRPAYSAACAVLAKKYAAEARARMAEVEAEGHSFTPR